MEDSSKKLYESTLIVHVLRPAKAEGFDTIHPRKWDYDKLLKIKMHVENLNATNMSKKSFYTIIQMFFKWVGNDAARGVPWWRTYKHAEPDPKNVH